jgi:hypothetical protein
MNQPKTKTIEITRPIVMYGKHAEKGELHEVPAAVAHELVGSGVAKHYDDDDDSSAGVRVDQPTQRDPNVQQRDPSTLRRAAPARPPAPAKPAQK